MEVNTNLRTPARPPGRLAAWPRRMIIPGALLIAVATCAYWLGTRDRSPVASAGVSEGEAPIPQVPLANLKASVEESATFFRHDFGVIRPGQTFKHRFPIKNPTQSTWSIRRFHTTCACAVSQASSPIVPPNRSVEVEVAYRAPNANKDDRHRVAVEFKEEGTPFVFLELSARVRDLVCAFPDKLDFGRVGRGQSSERAFDVHNYGDSDIQLLPSVDGPPWLAVQAEDLKATRTSDGPRQKWRVTVRANAAGLVGGKHQGSIKLTTTPFLAGLKPVPAEMMVRSPIEAIPGQLFLGSIAADRPSNHRVLVQFTPECLPETVGDITLKHNLGEALSLHCEKRGADGYDLVAVYSPTPGQTGLIEGTIRLSIPKDGVPELELPFFARVKAP